MKKLFLCLLSLSLFGWAQAQSRNAIEGRWDLTYNRDGRELPSWLEVQHSGIRTWVGHFVAAGGSARPVSEIFVEGSKFNFSIPPQWESQANYLKVEGEVNGETMSGSMTMPDGKTYSFTGNRAPVLKREKAPVWGSPIKLFNGKDLTGWQALGQTNQWVVESGVLKSPKSGANIRTEQTFTDFKLHVEFRFPKGSNSGVYLRGRYEVQIEDASGETEPWVGGLGAVYGFLKPSEIAARPAGEWQSYDITLIGRRVTVIANGKLIIQNQEIPGITGGALDSKEGEPGPIYFQGDHGPIEYRNIVITPAKG